MFSFSNSSVGAYYVYSWMKRLERLNGQKEAIKKVIDNGSALRKYVDEP